MAATPTLLSARRLARLLPAFLLAAAIPGDGAGAEAAPAGLSATYRVHFAGINLGKVDVSSRLVDGRYRLQGSAKLEFLGGVLWELRGGSHSAGAMTGQGPTPAEFSFHFRNGKKRGKLDMRFQGNAVSAIETDLPEPVDRARYVPVAKQDLVGVFDPLTALFITATWPRGDTDASVCDRRLPVFDGKHRFDLQLSHKQTVQVQKRGRSGYGGPAVICQVKYIPVSGYKRNQQGVQFVAGSNDIEVWLIPVRDAGLYLPYHIRVPTPYGPASATSASFQVELDGQRKIVLVN